MVDERISEVIEQLTLRKLDFARDLLKSRKRAYTGTREKLRERLEEAYEKKAIKESELVTLLDELDAWGDQRIRIVRFGSDVLKFFGTWKDVEDRIREAQLESLVDGNIDLVPPPELTRMRIVYEELPRGRFLRLTAAKTRETLVELPEAPEVPVSNDPAIVWKPYRRELQKCVAMAEVNLDDGQALVSVAMLKRGNRYEIEFDEFYRLFFPLIPFERASVVSLYQAAHNARYQLSPSEVQLFMRRIPTQSGGSLDLRAHSGKADIRSDPQLTMAEQPMINQPCKLCNCFWEIGNGLGERVHTHIHSEEGEVAISGQIREASARHVLQRIIAIN